MLKIKAPSDYISEAILFKINIYLIWIPIGVFTANLNASKS